MTKKRALLVALLSFAVLVAAIIAAVYVYLAPSNTKRELSEQYKDLPGDQLLIVVDNKVTGSRALLREGHVYVPLETVSQSFNKRFFWDNKEKILTYVLPDGVVSTGVNTERYTVGLSQERAEAAIVIQEEKVTYILVDFIKKYSPMEYQIYKNPGRLVTISDFENPQNFVVLGSSARLRVGPNKKYDYLIELEKGQKLYFDPEGKIENGYYKVMTLEGIEGYIPETSVDSQIEETASTEYEEPIFKQTKFAERVCLAWHQVTNQATNAYLSNAISGMRGVNVISPTWLSLSDNKGNFTSLASETYVREAHNAGLKVWVLVDDFNKKVKLNRLLSRTSTRQKLINNLVGTAIQYGVDGINIDFERVTEESSAAYLEFLRELSLKCRSNQLVLSVDNYMPKNYNAFYDCAEQGKVVDYVIFMGYDEHYAGSEEAGSVSSIGFVQEGLETALQMIPKERVVMALPFYTRLWKEKKMSGRTKVTSEAYGMDSAEQIVKDNGGLAKWDDTTGQYYAEFKSNKEVCKIWLEEEKSLELKMQTVTAKDVAGLAFWKLGFERDSIWDVVEKYLK